MDNNWILVTKDEFKALIRRGMTEITAVKLYRELNNCKCSHNESKEIVKGVFAEMNIELMHDKFLEMTGR